MTSAVAMNGELLDRLAVVACSSTAHSKLEVWITGQQSSVPVRQIIIHDLAESFCSPLGKSSMSKLLPRSYSVTIVTLFTDDGPV